MLIENKAVDKKNNQTTKLLKALYLKNILQVVGLHDVVNQLKQCWQQGASFTIPRNSLLPQIIINPFATQPLLPGAEGNLTYFFITLFFFDMQRCSA